VLGSCRSQSQDVNICHAARFGLPVRPAPGNDGGRPGGRRASHPARHRRRQRDGDDDRLAPNSRPSPERSTRVVRVGDGGSSHLRLPHRRSPLRAGHREPIGRARQAVGICTARLRAVALRSVAIRARRFSVYARHSRSARCRCARRRRRSADLVGAGSDADRQCAGVAGAPRYCRATHRPGQARTDAPFTAARAPHVRRRVDSRAACDTRRRGHRPCRRCTRQAHGRAQPRSSMPVRIRAGPRASGILRLGVVRSALARRAALPARAQSVIARRRVAVGRIRRAPGGAIRALAAGASRGRRRGAGVARCVGARVGTSRTRERRGDSRLQ